MFKDELKLNILLYLSVIFCLGLDKNKQSTFLNSTIGYDYILNSLGLKQMGENHELVSQTQTLMSYSQRPKAILKNKLNSE